METQREADYRGLWEAREKAQRHAGYLKLKAEFEPS
jgi:hypothetical protein